MNIFIKIHNNPNSAIVNSERGDIMVSSEELLQKIEQLRIAMYELVSIKNDLADPDIVYISQELDNLLNYYEELMRKTR